MIELKSLVDWDYEIWAEGFCVGWVRILWEETPRLDCFLEEMHRGNGYALAACNEVLELLENEGTSLVCAQCQLENAPAMRLLSRLGFELKRVWGEELFFEALL